MRLCGYGFHLDDVFLCLEGSQEYQCGSASSQHVNPSREPGWTNEFAAFVRGTIEQGAKDCGTDEMRFVDMAPCMANLLSVFHVSRLFDVGEQTTGLRVT